MRGKKVSNLDHKESIDWNAFYRCILEINSPVILIDGFITFADERSSEIVDICVLFEYNINTDFQIALNRRIHRCSSFQKCVIPNDYLQNPFINDLNYRCTYFHDIVWPEMMKHPEYRKPNNWGISILNLSATDSFQNNFTKTMNFIQGHIDFYIY